MPRAAIALGLSLVQHWPVSDEKIGFEYKVKRLLEGSLMTPERAHVYWNGTFSDEQSAGLVKEPLPDSLGQILAEARSLPRVADDLAPFLWLDQKYYLADDILTKSDRMSMAHSVEVRPPFLDHRIVEFAATLPASLKIRGTQQKVLLKQLMKDKLPPAVVQRKKVGFDIPAHEWLRGPLRALLQDALQYGLEEYEPLFSRNAVEQLAMRHFQREVNAGYHLWGLLILFLWMKKWRVQIQLPSADRTISLAAVGSSLH
jgi:asparagine synthase (glutamine-hydrolysing)